MKVQSSKNKKHALLLAITAGCVYSSWILGYVLNMRVALDGTASELAAFTQPMRELYVVGDYIVAALMILVCIILRADAKSAAAKSAVTMYGIAAIFIAAAAHIALLCSTADTGTCAGSDVNTRFILHNAIGVLANFSLFLAIIFAAQTGTRHMREHFQLQFAAIGWAFLGLSTILVSSEMTNPLLHGFQQRLFLVVTAAFMGLFPRLLRD